MKKRGLYDFPRLFDKRCNPRDVRYGRSQPVHKSGPNNTSKAMMERSKFCQEMIVERLNI